MKIIIFSLIVVLLICTNGSCSKIVNQEPEKKDNIVNTMKEIIVLCQDLFVTDIHAEMNEFKKNLKACILPAEYGWGLEESGLYSSCCHIKPSSGNLMKCKICCPNGKSATCNEDGCICT